MVSNTKLLLFSNLSLNRVFSNNPVLLPSNDLLAPSITQQSLLIINTTYIKNSNTLAN